MLSTLIAFMLAGLQSPSIPTCVPAVEVQFNSHEPVSQARYYGPYLMMLVGEKSRRGENRSVIAENAGGVRSTLAVWVDGVGNDESGRWVTEDDGTLWEDVRANASCFDAVPSVAGASTSDVGLSKLF
jgi:hypothetical protein